MPLIRKIVVAIYVDPDFFPPTLYSIMNLAGICEELVLISRNNCNDPVVLPANVRHLKMGPFCTVRQMELQGKLSKGYWFLRFAMAVKKQINSPGVDLVVLFDHMALYAFRKVSGIKRRFKVWYHNHDMPIPSSRHGLGIGDRATATEASNMIAVDYFSLPNRERLQFYPDWIKLDHFFVIPNFPSLAFYNAPKNDYAVNGKIRIIYQGFVSEGRLLEELIELMGTKLNGYLPELWIKGPVEIPYKQKLNQLAESLQVAQNVKWFDIGPYKELPILTRQADIGLGANLKDDPISNNMTTATNKVFEYAASGLPVIINDSPQFKKYLGNYDWVYFTNGTQVSLQNAITSYISKMLHAGKSARHSFETELNFERNFKPAMHSIINDILTVK